MSEEKKLPKSPILSFRVPREVWTEVNSIVGDGDRTAVCVHLLRLGLEQWGANPLDVQAFTPVGEFKKALSRQDAMESKLQELAQKVKELEGEAEKKLDLAA